MTEQAANAEGEWISADDASKLAIERSEDIVTFQSSVAQLLRHGLLKARAEAVWIEKEPVLSKAWKNISSAENIERNILVPVNYWRSDIRASEDRERWRWPVNKFAYTINENPFRRRMIAGVEFCLSDLKNKAKYI